MNVEFMCGLLANYSKELYEAETIRERGDVQLKPAKLILDRKPAFDNSYEDWQIFITNILKNEPKDNIN